MGQVESVIPAEVRRAGATGPEASISQELEVEALPEIVTGPTGERIRTTAAAGDGAEPGDESLTGTIPAGLGRLFALTTLDLSGNQLTGTEQP